MNSNQPTTAQRLLAISGGLALVVFLVFGSVFHAWGVAWVAFLVPCLIRRWVNAGDGGCNRRQRHTSAPVSLNKQHTGYGVTQTDAPAPYPYIDKN